MNDRKGNCWPNDKQELLLRAALFSGEEAINAWRLWKLDLNLQEIDPASFRLLPLLYRNLKSNGIDDPMMHKLKGVYRHTWSKNQMLLRAMDSIVTIFHKAGIDSLVLKGAALLKLHYEDDALRPMNDLDLLIPENRATEAIQLLQDADYTPAFDPNVSFNERYLPLIHAYGFSKSGKVQIDLHWHVLQDCRKQDSDADFWSGSVSFDFCTTPVRALNAADQLLHILVHGLKWDIIPPIRWIADAITVLRKTPDLDWQRLAWQTRKRKLTLPVQEALTFLSARFNAAIPTTVLEELKHITVSRSERVEYRYKMKDYHREPLGHLPLLWFSYIRSSDEVSPRRKLAGFASYLKQFWGAQSPWQLPLKAFPRAIRRLRIMSKRG